VEGIRKQEAATACRSPASCPLIPSLLLPREFAVREVAVREFAVREFAVTLSADSA
jgi:hypothetical protein